MKNFLLIEAQLYRIMLLQYVICVQPDETTAGVEDPEKPLHAIRKWARLQYFAAAERMKRVYDASHKANIYQHSVGDAVALTIPQTDRSLQRSCVVCHVE